MMTSSIVIYDILFDYHLVVTGFSMSNINMYAVVSKSVAWSVWFKGARKLHSRHIFITKVNT